MSNFFLLLFNLHPELYDFSYRYKKKINGKVLFHTGLAEKLTILSIYQLITDVRVY